jgi:hypothetical protein
MKTRLPVISAIWVILTLLLFGISWFFWNYGVGLHIQEMLAGGSPLGLEEWFLWMMWGINPLIAAIWCSFESAIIVVIGWMVFFSPND